VEEPTAGPGRWEERGRGRPGRRLLLVVGALLALGVVAEVGIRVRDAVRGVSPRSHNYSHFLFRAHPYRGYALVPGVSIRFAGPRTITVNSLGFRGPEFAAEKPAGTLRIFCLGESSTFGLAESDEQVWPRRLEERLRAAVPGRRVEVVNAGVPGYSSYESLVYLEQEIVRYAPDAVVVYHTWNDAVKVGSVGATGSLPETGILRIRHVEKHGWLRDLLNLSAAFGVFEARVLDPLWARRQEGRWFYQRLFDERNVEIDLAAFERNLRTIVRFSEENGFRAILCTQTLRKGEGGGPLPWTRFLPLCEAAVRRVAAEPGGALADVARGVEGTDDRLVDSTHFSPKGSEAMAGFLAGRLLELGLYGTR
jgi:lysophospholipase L1-like esterase